MQTQWRLVAGAVILLTACKENRPVDAAQVNRAPAVSQAGDTNGNKALQATVLLPTVRKHLDSVQASPGLMQGQMAAHVALTETLLDAMQADMARLGLHSDPTYSALIDSVLQDVIDLPRASGEKLTELERAHLDRVRRLVAVYETAVNSKQ